MHSGSESGMRSFRGSRHLALPIPTHISSQPILSNCYPYCQKTLVGSRTGMGNTRLRQHCFHLYTCGMYVLNPTLISVEPGCGLTNLSQQKACKHSIPIVQCCAGLKCVDHPWMRPSGVSVNNFLRQHSHQVKLFFSFHYVLCEYSNWR